MAKLIFQGKNGLSNSIKNEDDKYSVGYLIDPFREWGFLKPGVAGTTITGISDGQVRDMADSNALLALAETKIFTINTSTNAATLVWTRPGSEATYRLMQYSTKVGGTLNSNAIFYFYGTTAGLYDGSSFNDNWMATTPAGAAAVGSSSKPYIWKGYMMIASSQYIHKFDGNNGDNGTLTANWFDLGTNWTTTSFFTYYDYLGVVIGNSSTGQSQILLLDGSSTTEPVKRISITDSVYNSVNINNDLIFITNNGIKQLGDNGLDPIKELQSESSSSVGTLGTISGLYSDVFNNKLYFGGGVSNANIVGMFARKDINNPYIIANPYNSTGNNILMVRSVGGYLFVSSYTSTNYYLQYFSAGNAAATLKYTFKDFGRKIIAKYLKFYFKPLASGDSITFGIDTDYGTSTTLGTATYATNGAITSKRFEIKKPCHSLRPTVVWSSGGASISYAVLDYEETSDI